MDTLIFVDVDGVLNVGIGDPGNAPLELSIQNVSRALTMWDRRQSLSPEVRACAERVASVHSRKSCAAEGGTYAKLISADNSLSEVAVGRLAKLIQAAGERCTVVLSSTWRLPKHVHRLKRLEEALSLHLGRPFTFGDRTSLNEDRTADGRLRCIGNYVAKHCARSGPASSNLRVMLLEDFHVRPLGSWKCDGRMMNSPADVEEYLCACVPNSVNISAKLIHTYDEWLTESGLLVQIGCGLSKAHVCEGLNFLGGMQKEIDNVRVPRCRRQAGKTLDSPLVLTCRI